MEDKPKRCRRCHGGILHPTVNPNEMKCGYCGWTKIEINLADYGFDHFYQFSQVNIGNHAEFIKNGW
jgi:hypothetical protein